MSSPPTSARPLSRRYYDKVVIFKMVSASLDFIHILWWISSWHLIFNKHQLVLGQPSCTNAIGYIFIILRDYLQQEGPDSQPTTALCIVTMSWWWGDEFSKSVSAYSMLSFSRCSRLQFFVLFLFNFGKIFERLFWCYQVRITHCLTATCYQQFAIYWR